MLKLDKSATLGLAFPVESSGYTAALCRAIRSAFAAQPAVRAAEGCDGWDVMGDHQQPSRRPKPQVERAHDRNTS